MEEAESRNYVLRMPVQLALPPYEGLMYTRLD